LALRFCRSRRKGSALQNLAGALHTDGVGCMLSVGREVKMEIPAYNMKLSLERADAVKKWLVENAGIKPSRITTTGWGETKPVAPNTKPDGSDDPVGKQKNRRVELTLRTG
jgi:hypothetical protein